MPSPSDEPLRKVNINLYSADADWLYRRHGHGWTEVVRRLVRAHIKEQEQPQEAIVWPSKTP